MYDLFFKLLTYIAIWFYQHTSLHSTLIKMFLLQCSEHLTSAGLNVKVMYWLIPLRRSRARVKLYVCPFTRCLPMSVGLGCSLSPSSRSLLTTKGHSGGLFGGGMCVSGCA